MRRSTLLALSTLLAAALAVGGGTAVTAAPSPAPVVPSWCTVTVPKPSVYASGNGIKSTVRASCLSSRTSNKPQMIRAEVRRNNWVVDTWNNEKVNTTKYELQLTASYLTGSLGGGPIGTGRDQGQNPSLAGCKEGSYWIQVTVDWKYGANTHKASAPFYWTC